MLFHDMFKDYGAFFIVGSMKAWLNHLILFQGSIRFDINPTASYIYILDFNFHLQYLKICWSQIVYYDDDVEILLLKNERWEFAEGIRKKNVVSQQYLSWLHQYFFCV